MESDDGSVRVRQRRDALAHANRLRVARAGLKRRIAAGEVSAAEVILRSSWELESMPIANLLMSQRGWGQQRCRGFLIAIGIRETSANSASHLRFCLTLACTALAPFIDRPEAAL